MKTIHAVVGAMLLPATCFGLTNPSFKDGLTGWNSIGTVNVNAYDAAMISAYGADQDHLAPTMSELLAFAPIIGDVVPQSVWQGTHPWVQTYYGSAIEQAFTITEDSFLRINLERWGSSLQVFAVALTGPAGTKSFLGSSWDTGFSTPVWNHPFNLVFSAPAGDYDLVFASMGTHFHWTYDTGIAVSDIDIKSKSLGVPDGGCSAGLLGIGLLCLAFVRR